MSKTVNSTGDLVSLTKGVWAGSVGVVTLPISKPNPGQVLVHKNGHILGVNVTIHDAAPSDKSSEGFAQLAYNLIKLGSHVIEKGSVSV